MLETFIKAFDKFAAVHPYLALIVIVLVMIGWVNGLTSKARS